MRDNACICMSACFQADNILYNYNDDRLLLFGPFVV